MLRSQRLRLATVGVVGAVTSTLLVSSLSVTPAVAAEPALLGPQVPSPLLQVDAREQLAAGRGLVSTVRGPALRRLARRAPAPTATASPTASPVLVPRTAPLGPAPSGATVAAPRTAPVGGTGAASYFPRGTAFWDAVPAGPRLDPASTTIARAMAAPGASRILNVTQYGQPIYEADATTPRYRLAIKNLGPWGDNDLAHHLVPVPRDAVPSPGTDGKIVVIDRAARLVFDLWQAERTATGWSVSWGGVYDLDGDGSGYNATHGSGPYSVPWPQRVSRGTGAGLSSLAGVLRVSEMAAGRIDHALVFSTDIACGPANSTAFRFPATTTDGWVSSGTCIEQGTRLQLDPSIDLRAIPGITKAELAIGQALQRYGAYAMDVGGARMAIVSEMPETAAEQEVYADAGVAWDYWGLTKLPWDRLRVLAAHDGR